MSEIVPRITGTEMEWSIMVQKEPGADFAPITSRQIPVVIANLPEGLLHIKGMLSNGGRMYADCGEHLEYATPEDPSFFGTVTNEIAGEEVVYRALDNVRKNGDFYDFIMNKRVVDDLNHTWGYHASFCAPADKISIDEEHLAPLGLHLATQNLYTGAGAVQRYGGNKARYVLAQKVLNLNCDFYSSTNGPQQPLVSLRKEAHADDRKWTRVHLTSMDANISPWATWMQLGTTSIVLRMAEHGYRAEELMPRNPMHLLAIQVATDLTLKQTVELQSGVKRTPLQLQRREYELARRFADTIGVTPEEELVLQEWDRALTDLETDPSLLVDRSDWAAKHQALLRYMGRHGIATFAHPDMAKKDRQWDERSPLVVGDGNWDEPVQRKPRGIGLAMRQKAWRERMPQESAVEHAMQHAPTTSRAYVREQLVRKHAGNNDIGMEWSVLRRNGTIVLRFADPHQTDVAARTPSGTTAADAAKQAA